ncbi:MAG: nucleotidyltransferase family protein [bacterium]|nr:nucleotidyltransferase family protein [bacterium]
MNTAMILCAGFGTRMKDYTKETPKVMLPIDGKPILEYTINHLAKLGINNIIINLHYFPDQITSYFSDGKKFGVNITYSYEEEPLGTAGAIKKVEKSLTGEDDFLLLYGDIVCNQDYYKLYEFHRTNPGAIATIILHERNKSNSIVEMDINNKITRFIERPDYEVTDKKQNWVNSGLYCLNRKILDIIPENRFYDFPRNIFTKIYSEGSLFGYPLNGYRCAIDSPERYSKVQNDFSKEQIFPI